MTEIKAYLLSVVAASMVCCILKSLAGKTGAAYALVQLTAGVFLTLTVLTPVIRLDLSSLILPDGTLLPQAEAIAQEGAQIAEESMAAIIKQQLEAYILDKAEALGAALQVEVSLDEDNCTPERVVLKGAAAPYAKMRLEEFLRQELGIAKENQVWVG